MPAEISTRIEALDESTRSLQRTIADLTDQQAREPSLLPGWSRGHVLTHVARNSDAMLNLVRWASTGVETLMYPSREARNEAIEAQSGRSADELRGDIEASHERLLSALRELTDAEWQTEIRWGPGATSAGSASAIPLLRRAEVEIHHVDLDLDYTLAHWPEDFVERQLADVVRTLNSRDDSPGFVLVGNDDEGRWVVGSGEQEITGPPPALLGWLIGRTTGIGLHSDSALPTLGIWI